MNDYLSRWRIYEMAYNYQYTLDFGRRVAAYEYQGEGYGHVAIKEKAHKWAHIIAHRYATARMESRDWSGLHDYSAHEQSEWTNVNNEWGA